MNMNINTILYIVLEVLGPSGPRVLSGGLGALDFVVSALRALRPCDLRVGDWIVC